MKYIINCLISFIIIYSMTINITWSATKYYKAVIAGTDIQLSYELVNGYAVYQGDIILGQHEQIQKDGIKLSSHAAKKIQVIQNKRNDRATLLASDYYFWPSGIIYYKFGSRLSEEQKEELLQAMAHWEERTIIQFEEKLGPGDKVVINYDDTIAGCWSYVGYLHQYQEIMIGQSCPRGSMIHELGHTIGFWHEQSRIDRDDYVYVNTANIPDEHEGNFEIESFSQAIGDYDFRSTMHYSPYAFAIDSVQPTLIPLDDSRDLMNIRNNITISAGDISGVEQIYGSRSSEVSRVCESAADIAEAGGIAAGTFVNRYCIADALFPANTDHRYTHRYSLSLSESTVVTLSVPMADMDTVITVMDSSATNIIAQSDPDGLSKPKISMQLAADDYLLFLHSPNLEYGNYQLQYAIEADQPCEKTSGMLIENQAIAGELTTEDCYWFELFDSSRKRRVDVYEVNLDAEKLLDITLTFPSLYAYFIIQNAKNDEMITTSYCDIANSQSLSTQLPKGRYKLLVTACIDEDVIDSYDLSIAFSKPESQQRSLYLLTDNQFQLANEIHFISDEARSFVAEAYDNLGRKSTGLLSRQLSDYSRIMIDDADVTQSFADVSANNTHLSLNVSADDSFILFNTLHSSSGLVTNNSCSEQFSTAYFSGYPDSVGYLKLTNKAFYPKDNVRITVYDQMGNVIGNENSLIVDRLDAFATEWFGVGEIQQRIGDVWAGGAFVQLHSSLPDITVQGFSRIADNLINHSCAAKQTGAEQQALVVNPAVGLDSELHIINMSDTSVSLKGTLYDEQGNVLGAADTALSVQTINSKGRLVLSTDSINGLFDNQLSQLPLTGILSISADESIRLVNLIRHANGQKTDLSCFNLDRANLIATPGSGMSSYIGIFNMSFSDSGPVSVTVYTETGSVLVTDAMLLTTLTANSHVWINRDYLQSLLQINSQERLRMVLNDNTDQLKVVNINQVQGMFINFSCND